MGLSSCSQWGEGDDVGWGKRKKERERGWIHGLGHNEAHQAQWALSHVTSDGSPSPSKAWQVRRAPIQNPFALSITDPRKCRSRKRECERVWESKQRGGWDTLEHRYGDVGTENGEHGAKKKEQKWKVDERGTQRLSSSVDGESIWLRNGYFRKIEWEREGGDKVMTAVAGRLARWCRRWQIHAI